MATKNKAAVSIIVRFPDSELHAKAKALAGEKRLSLNSLILNAVEEYLKKHLKKFG